MVEWSQHEPRTPSFPSAMGRGYGVDALGAQPQIFPAWPTMTGASGAGVSKHDDQSSNTAAARAFLEAEMFGRLRALELSVQSQVAEEIRCELDRITVMRPSMGVKVAVAIAERSLVESLKSELRMAMASASSMWTRVGELDRRAHELEAVPRADAAEARAETKAAEAAIERVLEDLQSSEAQTARLISQQSALQQSLRNVEAAFERRDGPLLLGDAKRTATRLEKRTARLEVQAARLEEQEAQVKREAQE
eukprot:CAMPEP_0183584120 /NCGR_PEP_ID=MMETSP0371-20130417/152942_1 /TAXON_ID=268820 /ORGANISM="Peridinium aciculiferum, Strain PAER-2" /LENGTH=250 /DNA_ID=CAMNT_0025795021 /DNA_START=27 /DNA_END=776 /DNA_ORIENTATION=+